MPEAQGAAIQPGRQGPASPPPAGPDVWSVPEFLGARRLDVLALIPLVAIVALVALVAVLVFLVAQADAGRARAKLATDALWVEQTLRFQMAVDEDFLVRLALEAAGGTPQPVLTARGRMHVAANPETLALRWYGPDGGLVAAVPEGGGAAEAALAARLLASGAVTSRPVYGAVENGVVPVAQRVSATGGVVVASVSLPMMLDRHIPWWIAEQYGVRLTDTAGTLAERTRRPIDAAAPRHSISFEPPLVGTTLEIMAYDAPAAFGNTTLLAAILALSVFAILALAALHRNADRRRLAEERLRAEMAFRRAMEESLTVGLRAKDSRGRILYVNAAFCKLVGSTPEALIGRDPPMPYWAPDALEETLARQRQLAEGQALPQAFETRFVRSDGAEIEVQVYEAPLIDAGGRHRGWMGSIIDITEAKRAARIARAQDESLARTGRLVTLGEMASTLAHELNQPLAAIASYAAGGLNLFEQERPDPAMLRSAFEKMAAQARRAGLIIRRVQDFVKKRTPQLAPLDLAEVVGEALALMAANARERRVKLSSHVEGPIPQVMADRILIEQVLVNLIRNGIEAMADEPRHGNDLTVRVGQAGGAVVLDVMDRGHGISDAVAARLFDPFTSTKSQGMGMGLNICRSIVELHHGSLGHAPRPGGGTVFSVTLPLAPEKVFA
ncbi:two-component hybrid sensor and regulator [Rhodovulum sp. PH10]|uniref:sensor histidine kinase n=1 Tax=Rhodovulum sp. PH10 TaxID=1187851 RepID=UPI00027C1ED7|nr:PAS domain-containing sensor histidine kinase [Rhodovulum sp. PH10]EJW09728.1 two-component hybrid sensor and regulator [Rhodovulum sp. PH10]